MRIKTIAVTALALMGLAVPASAGAVSDKNPVIAGPLRTGRASAAAPLLGELFAGGDQAKAQAKAIDAQAQ